MHGMLAGMSKTPEFALAKEEANALATGLSRVARHYDMGASQKTLDWVQLFGVLGAVYAPRFIAIQVRRAGNRAKPVNPPAPSRAPEQPAADGPTITIPGLGEVAAPAQL